MNALLQMITLSQVLAFAALSAAPSQAPTGILRTATMFTIGGVGFGNTPSNEERAFRAVLRGPDAAKEFHSLLVHGTPAGQLYALLGLRTVDEAAFDRALPRFKDSTTKVETMTGCLAWDTTMGELAQLIANRRLN